MRNFFHIFTQMHTVLQIRDVYLGSEFCPSRIQGQKIPSKNSSIFNLFRDVYPGSGSATPYALAHCNRYDTGDGKVNSTSVRSYGYFFSLLFRPRQEAAAQKAESPSSLYQQQQLRGTARMAGVPRSRNPHRWHQRFGSEKCNPLTYNSRWGIPI